MKLSKFFSFRKPKIIQIGVGGATSCGKTMLIDAMFSVLDSSNYPAYLHNKMEQFKTCSEDIFDGNYKDYSKLRSFVSTRFHDPTNSATPVETGDFDVSTYWINLRLKGEKCILLIRNLPGEMFGQYFRDDFFNVLNGNSLNYVFEDFIKGHKDYKKNKYKCFFVNNQVAEAEKLKKEFLDHLMIQYSKDGENEKTSLEGHGDFEDTKKNFYAYLFYKSSETVIRCVRANISNIDENDMKINYYMCEGSIFVQNDYICITQFDRILKNKTHFNFKIDGEKWIHYAKSMSEIYNDIVEENFTIIEKEKWKNSKPQKLTQIMPYISSVAFHYGDNNFWGFKDVEGDKDVEKKWSLDQNQYRTSLGVVELVSNILRRYNIKLPLPSLTDDNVAKEYNEFIKRFYDNYN